MTKGNACNEHIVNEKKVFGNERSVSLAHCVTLENICCALILFAGVISTSSLSIPYTCFSNTLMNWANDGSNGTQNTKCILKNISINSRKLCPGLTCKIN